MRLRAFYIAVLLILASAAFLAGRPFLTPSLARADKPDLIVFFTGDIQGYLEECG
jgi:hypothetical protein